MAKLLQMPQFLRLLFFVEMWERFSYYGMRALLVLFLTQEFGFSDPKAYAVYSLFAALGYAGPPIGGWLADRYFGFRNMVFLGAIVISLGHVSMTFVGFNPFLFYFGLGLIAIGTGLFKGNITNLVGCCYAKDDPERERGFTLFYVSVNLGSFLASIACGLVAKIYGWHYGFGLAAIGMMSGFVLFAKYQHVLGQNGLAPNPEIFKSKINLKHYVFVISIALSVMLGVMMQSAEEYSVYLTYMGLPIFGAFMYAFIQSNNEERKNLLLLMVLIFFFMCFFAIEMQLGSLISLFTERNVNNTIFGIEVPSSFSQAINPFSIMICGPFLSQFFLRIGPKWSLIRYSFGLLTMFLCFLMLYFACSFPNEKAQISYAYLFVSISLMGIGELFIAPLLYSYCTVLSPDRIRGFMMGVLNLSLSYANLFGLVIAKFMSVPKDANSIVDPFVSLEIYKNGFWQIAIVNLALVCLFFALLPVLNRAVFGKNKVAA